MVELDKACPGCVPQEGHIDLPYIWMGEFVRHLIRARLNARETEVQAVFEVVERRLEEARPGSKLSEESNLIVVGFIADLQNGNLHPDGSSPADFHRYLGPKSQRAWGAMNGFWEMVAGAKPV